MAQQIEIRRHNLYIRDRRDLKERRDIRDRRDSKKDNIDISHPPHSPPPPSAPPSPPSLPLPPLSFSSSPLTSSVSSFSLSSPPPSLPPPPLVTIENVLELIVSLREPRPDQRTPTMRKKTNKKRFVFGKFKIQKKK